MNPSFECQIKHDPKRVKSPPGKSFSADQRKHSSQCQCRGYGERNEEGGSRPARHRGGPFPEKEPPSFNRASARRTGSFGHGVLLSSGQGRPGLSLWLFAPTKTQEG